MAQIVEISLKIPSLRVRKEGTDTPETIANGDVRYIKRMELESIPKAGVVLVMDVSPTGPFDCEVVRSDWHDDKNMFVVACRYSKRSISFPEYQALTDSPEWEVRPLISGL